jgi:membrane associated rhomboid family serine protease
MIPLQDDSPSAHKAYVTISLIGVCCLAFLWQRSLDDAAARRVVAVGRHGGDGVAFRAHIAGFLAGILLVPLLKRRDTPLFAP